MREWRTEGKPVSHRCVLLTIATLQGTKSYTEPGSWDRDVARWRDRYDVPIEWGTVSAWMPLPEPYQPEQPDEPAATDSPYICPLLSITGDFRDKRPCLGPECMWWNHLTRNCNFNVMAGDS